MSIYAVLGGLSAAENVFPPLPADTIIAVGAFLSHYGGVTPQAVLAVVWAANIIGASAVYVAGRTVGRQFFTGRVGSRLLNERRLQRLEYLYRRHGTWGIFVSRFLPGVRAVVPPFAGIARVPVARALLPVIVASAMWYGALTFAVVMFADSIEQIIVFIDHVNRASLVVVGLIVGVVITIIVRRWRRR